MMYVFNIPSQQREKLYFQIEIMQIDFIMKASGILLFGIQQDPDYFNILFVVFSRTCIFTIYFGTMLAGPKP